MLAGRPSAMKRSHQRLDNSRRVAALNQELRLRISRALYDWRRVVDAIGSSSRTSEAEQATRELVTFLESEAERSSEEGRAAEAEVLRCEAALHAGLAERLREIGDDNNPRLVEGISEAPDFGTSGPGWSLIRRGRNARGVPIYIGNASVPSEGEPGNLLLVVLVLAAFSLWLDQAEPSGLRGIVACVIAGVAFFLLVMAGGVWLRGRRLRGLVPIQTASRDFGLPELSLLLQARERGVEPRCIINGEEYYRPGDFGDVDSLLRAADAPRDANSTLVRPAQFAESKLEHLVRPTSESTEEREIAA